MKKSIKRLLGVTVAATALLLGQLNTAKADTTLTVGASAEPHAKILEHVKPELKNKALI